MSEGVSNSIDYDRLANFIAERFKEGIAFGISALTNRQEHEKTTEEDEQSEHD